MKKNRKTGVRTLQIQEQYLAAIRGGSVSGGGTPVQESIDNPGTPPTGGGPKP
jgi:hypothetical protein